MPSKKDDFGWAVAQQKDCYDCGLPVLSDDEKGFLLSLFEKFSQSSKEEDFASEDAAKGQIKKLIASLSQEQGIELDEEQANYLFDAASSHLVGFAPLDKMLNDASIEEIAAIGPHQPIYVYLRKKGWEATNAKFTSIEHLIHIINKMSRQLGRRITSHSPRLNAVLESAHRLHASIPPVSEGELTIRLHGSKPWSVADILNSRCTSAQALSFLWLAFQSDSSILIAGNTSSGKTTLLNALATFIPLNERMLIIEETPEIKIPHPHTCRLVSNEELKICMGELVRDSLRMRPDRVIVGEVRTPDEAKAYAETLLSGHARGSYATFHSQSADEAIKRLCNLGISEQDLPSLNFIVVQRRLARYDSKTKKQGEVRKMAGIYMLKPCEETGRLQAQAVFEFDQKTNSLEKNSNYEQAVHLLAGKLGISQNAALGIIAKRSAFLQKLGGEKDCDAVCAKVQKFAYG